MASSRVFLPGGGRRLSAGPRGKFEKLYHGRASANKRAAARARRFVHNAPPGRAAPETEEQGG
jgi:hypothetical protein